MSGHGHSYGRTAFTLVELMAVVVLVGIATTMVTVRLDGWTERGRLRSAARQIGAVVRMARNQAVSMGRPAVLEYVLNTDRMRILRPTLEDESIRWSGGEGIRLGHRVSIEAVRIGTDRAMSSHSADRDLVRCLIHSGGLVPDHRIDLSSGRLRCIVILEGPTGQEQLEFVGDAEKE